MIYDAIERAYTVLTTHFANDFAVLLGVKTVPAPAAVKIYKRQTADLFVQLNEASPTHGLPGLGIYATAAVTQANDQCKRDSTVTVACDYFLRGKDSVLVAKQVELAAEAIVQSVDRMYGDSVTGVWGAGFGEGSIAIELSETEDAPDASYQRRATVTFPVNDRDEV